MAGEGLGAWLVGLVSKARQLFTVVSQEFVQSHNRHKRSRSPSDVAHLLARVRVMATCIMLCITWLHFMCYFITSKPWVRRSDQSQLPFVRLENLSLAKWKKTCTNCILIVSFTYIFLNDWFPCLQIAE